MQTARGGCLRPRDWSLASQLFALQTLIVLVVLVGAGVAELANASAANEASARNEVLGVARAIATMPTVRDGLDVSDPTAVLQPLAERLRVDTGTDFVVIMTTAGKRFTHPNPAEIGGQFQGTIAPAVHGQPVIETYTGTLGPSVRAVVPVLDGGEVRGLVAVGRTVENVSREMTQQLPILFGTTAIALLLAGAGAWAVRRWLRRTTHDLGPVELSRMYEYYDAVLHAVREGLLLLDRDGKLQLFNDEARRLLALDNDILDRRVDDVGLPAALGEALAAGGERTDEIYLTKDRVVVVNQAAARWAGQRLGTVVTLRDHTELRALVSELKTIRGFADALSAQAHESANHLHTVVSLIELGRPSDALSFATRRLADSQHMTDVVLGGIGEPAVAALVLGKAAEATERGVELIVDEDLELPEGAAAPDDLVTIFGNLLDNAIDAASGATSPRWVRVESTVLPIDDGASEEVEIRIADSGPGVAAEDTEHAFTRGWSTKPKNRLHGRGLGLALVVQAVRRNHGVVEVRNDGGAVFTVRIPRQRTGDADHRPFVGTLAPNEPAHAGGRA
jgi:sensor histidine kinase regulating citrate/malate metabolism